MAVAATSTSSFIDRAAVVFSSTENVIEGAFWSTWCLFSTNQLREAISSKQESSTDLNPEEKTQKAWDANKNLVLSSCSFASGVTMVLSWANQVDLLPLGKLAGLVGAIGFGGSGVVSGANLVEKCQMLNTQKTAYFNAVDPKEKSNMALDAISTMIKVAFFAAMTSWGILGAAYSLYGGASLFVAQDLAFYYCVVTFIGSAATEIVIPLAKKLP